MKIYKRMKRKTKRNSSKKVFTDLEIPVKWIITALVIFGIAGFLLRVLQLDGVSLWVDEYVHVTRAQNVLKGTGPLLTNDNNGILLTIIMIPFFYLFGDTAFWARFPSVLFGTGLIVLIYLFARRLFNKYVGLLSAFLSAFSLYLVYWSRIGRNYMIFSFFFMLVLYLFFIAFENKKNDTVKSSIIPNIQLKYFVLFLIAFVLSLLSHQLTFLFIFGIIFYFIINELIILIQRKNYHGVGNPYFLGSVLGFLLLFFIFNPVIDSYVRSFLSLFLPGNIVNWVIPDWSHLKEFYEETPFKIFSLYADVIWYDLRWMTIPGVLGLILSWFVNKKPGIYIISLFLVPFLLMSFIFYDPALPRYLIYIYPLFIICVALFFYQVFYFISARILKPSGKLSVFLLFVIPFVLAAFTFRYTELESLTKAEKKLGYIVDKKLSHWSFTDWKYPCLYVGKLKKQGDIILSTVPTATNYYLKTDSSVIFRQRYFDSETKTYLNYTNENTELPDAKTVESLIQTFKQYERGWLIADYYFYNVMTDPAAMSLVCRHLDYHPGSTNDGGVLVFSWNRKDPPVIPYQTMLFVVGKSDVRVSTPKLNINLDERYFTASEVFVTINARFVSDKELIVVLNDKFKVFGPACKSNGIERLDIKVPLSEIKPGTNTLQVFYNNQVPVDREKGFVIHHLGMAFR